MIICNIKGIPWSQLRTEFATHHNTGKDELKEEMKYQYVNE